MTRSSSSTTVGGAEGVNVVLMGVALGVAVVGATVVGATVVGANVLFTGAPVVGRIVGIEVGMGGNIMGMDVGVPVGGWPNPGVGGIVVETGGGVTDGGLVVTVGVKVDGLGEDAGDSVALPVLVGGKLIGGNGILGIVNGAEVGVVA